MSRRKQPLTNWGAGDLRGASDHAFSRYKKTFKAGAPAITSKSKKSGSKESSFKKPGSKESSFKKKNPATRTGYATLTKTGSNRKLKDSDTIHRKAGERKRPSITRNKKKK